ncbi:MAG: hypothetical protein AMXMBFR7_25640 [Planctomycetota bacterium]
MSVGETAVVAIAVKKFLGLIVPKEIADEAIGMGVDVMRSYRTKLGVVLVKDVSDYFAKKGIDPRQVPVRFFAPYLEHATLHDEPDLHERWVALLRNAADPNFKEDVRPDFPFVLSQLSAKEVSLLDHLHFLTVEAAQVAAEQWGECGIGIEEVLSHCRPGTRDLGVLYMDNLMRLGLAAPGGHSFKNLVTGMQKVGNIGRRTLSLTSYGAAFVRACHTPKDAS